LNNYDSRVRNLLYILNKYGSNRFSIVMLEDEFGPAAYDPSIEAIVVSKETEHKCKRLNDIRIAKGLRPLDVVSIDLVLAEDGKRISSTRIRAGEIDAQGNLVA
jgi:pantetheine-phosphate adenylyltransferase